MGAPYLSAPVHFVMNGCSPMATSVFEASSQTERSRGESECSKCALLYFETSGDVESFRQLGNSHHQVLEYEMH